MLPSGHHPSGLPYFSLSFPIFVYWLRSNNLILHFYCTFYFKSTFSTITFASQIGQVFPSLDARVKINTSRAWPALDLFGPGRGWDAGLLGPCLHVPSPAQRCACCSVAASFGSASSLLFAPFRFLLRCSTSLVGTQLPSLAGSSSQCPWLFGPGIPLTLANWHLRTSFCHSILISDLEPLPVLQSGLMPSGIHLDG